MRLFIEPNDVLMFRDGRPFSGGEDHFARSIFPPAPSTFFGALRSKILSEKWEEFEDFTKGKSKELLKEIGSPDKLGSLTIKYFGLGAREQDSTILPYFPIPKDIVKIKGEKKGEFLFLKPEPSLSNMETSNLHEKLIPLWSKNQEAIEDQSGLLSIKDLEVYLLGNLPDSSIVQDELFMKEERTGIRRGRISRCVDQDEGGLYSVEYIRLKQDAGILIDVTGTNLLPPNGLLRIGGDHRTARYVESNWSMPDDKPIRKKVAEKGRFKLFLITPAIFKKGWLPDGIDNETLRGIVNEVQVKLVATSIGRPIGIGGFDLVKGRPKEMKRAVPPGSVYFFEIEGKDTDKIFKNIHLQSISDERREEGFGISLIGAW